MSKYKKGDRVLIRQFGEEGTVTKAGPKMAPTYSEDLSELEQLWQVKVEGWEVPRLIGESLLELIED